MMRILAFILIGIGFVNGFASREPYFIHATFDRSKSALVGAKIEPLTRATVLTLGQNLKQIDDLRFAALCAYLEPLYTGPAPRNLSIYAGLLPPLLKTCDKTTTNFNRWLIDVEDQINQQRKSSIAVLVSDGQLADDPNAKVIPTIVKRLTKNPKLKFIFVFGLRVDANNQRSASTFENATKGFGNKIRLATRESSPEILQELERLLR